MSVPEIKPFIVDAAKEKAALLTKRWNDRCSAILKAYDITNDPELPDGLKVLAKDLKGKRHVRTLKYEEIAKQRNESALLQMEELKHFSNAERIETARYVGWSGTEQCEVFQFKKLFCLFKNGLDLVVDYNFG